MVKKGAVFKSSQLRARYHNLLAQMNNLTYDYETIMRSDITDEFWEELKQRIEADNLITIAVSGETTSGKSTIALHIMEYINNLLIKKKINTKIDNYSCICSDEIEFNRYIMSDNSNVCVTVDEHSALAEVGENGSTEQALFEFYNDVCAQKFVHRIMCTPKSNWKYESNSTLVIKIIDRDKSEKTTFCKIYYNDPTSTSGENMPLGVIYFQVGDTIKRDWFNKYREKKFKRIDLTQKHGVKDVRQLEASEMVFEVYNDLKDFARYSPKGNVGGLVDSKIAVILQKKKLYYSLVGKALLQTPVLSLLHLEREIQQAKDKLTKPMPETQFEGVNKYITECEKTLNELINYHKKNIEVLEEYKKIK